MVLGHFLHLLESQGTRNPQLTVLSGAEHSGWDTLDCWRAAKEKSSLSRLLPAKDSISAALVFPIGLFVAVNLFGLYTHITESVYIYPEEMDGINPSWLNHTMLVP
ncbi:androgen-induced gene 1 protein-like [Opisthocomus hoazin]|uniref:androgen-induced gene 1 protein-like n=1 Tax=Opisthocomus hoazin TaxID=30419 RepID=UPI003F53C3D6